MLKSFKFAFEGIFSALKTENNLRIHILIMFLVILSAVLLKISLIEWMICLSLFALVISTELINTAIETTVDLAMPDKNEKAKRAKDISAAAVLISAIFSAIIGLIIFGPKIISLINT